MAAVPLCRAFDLALGRPGRACGSPNFAFGRPGTAFGGVALDLADSGPAWSEIALGRISEEATEAWQVGPRTRMPEQQNSLSAELLGIWTPDHRGPPSTWASEGPPEICVSEGPPEICVSDHQTRAWVR